MNSTDGNAEAWPGGFSANVWEYMVLLSSRRMFGGHFSGGGATLPTIQIDVLGPLVVRKDGTEVPPPAPLQRRVLSLLASRPGEVVSREWLATQMWGTASLSQQRGLQSYVSHLRGSLGTKTIELIGNGYRLAVDPDAVDEVRFRQQIEDGSAALGHGRYGEAIASLSQALSMWRGEPYEDLPRGDFVARRRGLDESRLTAQDGLLRAQIEMLRNVYEAEQLLATSSEWYVQQPQREVRVREHMRCLGLAGRVAEVATVVKEYQSALRSHAGSEAGHDLALLASRIMARDPEVLPEAWDSQVVLPQFSTPLIGRNRELSVAVSQLRSDSTRIMTLCGPDGVGKTRLAAAIAQELSRDLPGGVLWVDCGPDGSGVDLVPTLARMVGLTQSGHDLRMALPKSLGRRRTLVVLDGLQPQVKQPDVAVLLSSGPRLSVLATSQQRLGLASEQALEISGFPLDSNDGRFTSLSFVSALLDSMGVRVESLDEDAVRELLAACDGRASSLEQVALDLMMSPLDRAAS